MLLNHQDSLNNCDGLFHISEEPGIKVFEPRPSPSYFEGLTEHVVFAIAANLLHNYLLPRDCPRVTYYHTESTTATDRERFFGDTEASHIVVVETGWYQKIKETVLYCYEFAPDNFILLDACAGYYISYQSEIPIGAIQINDAITALLSRNVELRFTPSLIQLADAVSKSSLNFSLIRMRNAKS